jgi:NAD-dependent SIR2 family protein deacetylase
MRLRDQVAIVTGVSQPGQVGYALAAAFAREGALLAISARNAERVHTRAEALHAEGARVIAIPADLTTEEGVDLYHCQGGQGGGYCSECHWSRTDRHAVECRVDETNTSSMRRSSWCRLQETG